MFRIFIPTLIIASILLQPLAATAASPTDALEKQIAALRREVDRLLSQRVGTGTPPNYRPLTTEEMEQLIALGTEHLVVAQESSGHFRYEYVPYEDEYRNDDNIVRQAGTFYQLGELVRLGVAPQDLEETLHRSAEYFEGLSREGVHDSFSFRCIVDHAAGVVCKLGASSLALIGLIDFVEEYPEHRRTYDPLIEDYASYILAMKKDNAGFRNTFNVGQGRLRDDESSFSNGEALLALVRYYQYEQRDRTDREVRSVIDDAFAYLSSERVPFDTALYLWMMAALKDMDVLWPTERYREYAERYTLWRVQGFVGRRDTNHNMCAYAEGLASAYILLRDSITPERDSHLRQELDFWLWKNALLQVTTDDLTRLVTHSGKHAFTTAPQPAQALGGFLTGFDALTQRIDFTQHCLSTYAQTLAEIR